MFYSACQRCKPVTQRPFHLRIIIVITDPSSTHVVFLLGPLLSDTSFLGFFNCPEMRVICKHFSVYHICAPGHHENATAGSFK